jgi:hypothetical protein
MLRPHWSNGGTAEQPKITNYLKMKKIIFLLVGLTYFLTSCVKEEIPNPKIKVFEEREFNFIKSEDENKIEIIALKVQIVKENGKIKIKGKNIIEIQLETTEGVKTMFSYIDPLKAETREVTRKNGWLFDGNDCMVYCTYLEDSNNGTIVAERCCGDSAGNCTGFDPQCGGWT